MNDVEREQRIAEIRQQLEELRRRWPKHSVPPALHRQLEELEDELEQLLNDRNTLATRRGAPQ
ncbi:MAG: histidine kinase [Anaerolineae bacterium]